MFRGLLAMLLAYLLMSCSPTNLNLDSKGIKISETTAVGKFKLIGDGSSPFLEWEIFLFQSLDGLNFYVVEKSHKDDSFKNASDFVLLKAGHVYDLILKEYEYPPKLDPQPISLSRFWLGDELFWENGRIYPKIYYCDQIFGNLLIATE